MELGQVYSLIVERLLKAQSIDGIRILYWILFAQRARSDFCHGEPAFQGIL